MLWKQFERAGGGHSILALVTGESGIGKTRLLNGVAARATQAGSTVPYSAGGAYVNFMMDEGQDRVQATYRGNYERLAEIKRKYDPTNFFHVNQNIRPAS